MASVGNDEVEYESDPEEAKQSLTMRRREASDDEEERENPPRRIDSRVVIGSDVDSDGQGAAAEYDDDKESEVEEEEEYEDVEEEEEYEEREGEESVVAGGGDEVKAEAVVVMAELAADDEGDGERGRPVGESMEGQGVEEGEEEKKEIEPFAVPTAGAFYMHDDRFRDNSSGGGRHRRTLGGRKLWESKDDRKWGHDKFEEMSSQERHYEEGRRNSRGPRGRGKNRGADREYQRGNRPKAYNNNNQNNAPKTVKGRGPRRYEPAFRNSNEALPTQNKQYGKSAERTSHGSSGRAHGPTSNVERDPVPAGTLVFASSLSSASPPFYPSASSNKEITLTPKRDVPAGSTNRNLRPATMDENLATSQSNSMIRGKDVADSIRVDKQYIDDTISPVSGSSSINSTQFSQMSFQQPPMYRNQVNKVSPSTQMNTVQRTPVQSRVQPQPTLQTSSQQFVQRPSSGSQASSPPKAALSIKSFEPRELESPPESSKSKTALVGKVRGSVQGSGRGSFPYGGAQGMATSGNIGGGDQNFPPTPAFLPVMSFGGQNPGGMGVPALGMAFPGYVAQPQLGMGNSEMTWLPVLAGAAGGLGGSYCPPYITVDGAYHARPSGQASSSSASSKEIVTNKPSNEWNPPQKSELTSDEFGQRQNSARRYSKMNFGQ